MDPGAELESVRAKVLQTSLRLARMNCRLEALEKGRWAAAGGQDSSIDVCARVSLLEMQISDFLCCICLNEKRCMVFTPCHHHVTCRACCKELLARPKSTCPICRATVESVILVRGS
jgi:hypothetical protein